MKILAIVADINPERLGGAESHFVEVSKRLSPKIDLTICVGPDNSLQRLLPKAKFITTNYPHLPNFFGLFYILWATPQLFRHLLNNHYDLLWAKQEFPQAQVGALLHLLFKTPLYITSQNPLLGQEELVGIGSSFVTPLVSWAFQKATLIAAVSKFSATQATRLGARRVCIIPNGVDLQKFTFSSPNGKLKIISTSSLIPRNGIDVLVKAVAQLPASLPWHLTIAGDGPEKEKITSLISVHKLTSQITLLGRLPSNKIPALLKAHRLFIRPSRFEGFGSSFIEAMAAGLVVIGTPVGGITDFLIESKTGLLVPPDDPPQLARAIEKIWSDKKLYRKIQIQARKLVENKYSWEKIAKQVWSQFKTLNDKNK